MYNDHAIHAESSSISSGLEAGLNLAEAFRKAWDSQAMQQQSVGNSWSIRAS
jgi:hypothetical protein